VLRLVPPAPERMTWGEGSG